MQESPTQGRIADDSDENMTEEPENKESAVVVVAWRTGKKAHGRVVKAGGDVTGALRVYASDIENKIANGSGREYDPNDEQDDETTYLKADREELLDTALLEEIFKGASLPLASDEVLRKRPLVLYTLLLGNDPSKLRAYIRKRSPIHLAKKGIVALFDQTLTRVEKPLLAFDNFFDVVVYPDSVTIFHQKNFEGLFKESQAVLSKTTEWAESLSRSIPLNTDSVEWLAKRLRETSVMRRRVQSLLKSEYISKLTIETLRLKMEQQGLDPERLTEGDSLVLNRETEREILLFLNEDLWTGDFSGDQYAASRKSRR